MTPNLLRPLNSVLTVARGIAEPDARVARRAQPEVLGGGLDLVHQVDRVRRQVRSRTAVLVQRALQQHEPDERLAVPSVHPDHEVTLGTSGKPPVEDLPLHVAKVIVPR
jgi:hypothetical protein